jgi:hypothetical protein
VEHSAALGRGWAFSCFLLAFFFRYSLLIAASQPGVFLLLLHLLLLLLFLLLLLLFSDVSPSFLFWAASVKAGVMLAREGWA